MEVKRKLPDFARVELQNELGEEKVPLNSKMFNYNTKETLICSITIYIFPQFLHPLISACTIPPCTIKLLVLLIYWVSAVCTEILLNWTWFLGTIS